MTEQVRVVGRYALYNAIAAGGMATVHLGRLLGPVGFSRTVAIKRLHAQFASDPEFVSMFLDEARLAARIRHPNVVPTLDVVATGGELFLVMEYVPGESLARLSRVLRDRRQNVPLRVLSATIAGMLHGLHAAHEARDERGHPLGIVHRDVSPQNLLLGTDGVPRVLDFGVAKAAGRVQTTKEGQIKGKLSYMPPEQLRGGAVSRQTDIYSAGVMLWEMLTGQRLFGGDNEGHIIARVLEGKVSRPSQVMMLKSAATMTDGVMRQLEALDGTVLRAIDMNPERRFASAREMAIEIERCIPPATTSEVGDWVEHVARDVLHSRAAMIAEIESSTSMSVESRGGAVRDVLDAKATVTAHGRSSHPMIVQGMRPTLLSEPPLDVPPPVTQPSSISVTSSGAPGRMRERDIVRSSIAIAAAIALLGAIAIAAILYVRKPPAPPVVAAQPMVQPASTPAVPAEPAPAVSAAAAPAENELDAGLAMAAPPAPSPTPKATATGGGKKPPPPAAPTARPTAQAADDCNPSFYFEGGVKKYKPQCLTR